MRDHSRFELKTKLSRRFEDEVVESVLAEASERGWLAPDEEIAARAALAYARKLKSRRYIEAQLRKRGLPLVSLAFEEELGLDGEAAAGEATRARALAERKFGDLSALDYEGRARVFRFLKYRGFEDRWIRQVLNEK
jgi:regulatory protein